MRTTLAVALVLAAGLAAPLHAQPPSGTSSERTAATRSSVDYRSSEWLSDRKVFNNSNEHIANVSDLIVGRGSGRVEYLVVKTGTILGMGGKAVAIPYGAFRWNTEEDSLVLSSTTEQLKQFPEFSAQDWSAMVESRKDSRSPLRDRLTSDAARETDPYASALDTAKHDKVEGSIARIDRTRMDGYGEHTILTVTTPAGATRKVALGPSWFVNGGSTSLNRGDQVKIDTLALPRDPEGLSVATALTVNTREVRLRGSDGAPIWTLKTAESGGKSYDTHYWRYSLLSSITGAKIDCRGTECGKVQDTILDRTSGEIAFLSIDPNQNFLGVADTKRLIPWSITTIALDGTIRVDASKEMISASPETPKDLAALNTGTRAAMVYSAFQVSPPNFDPVKPAAIQTPDTNDAWLSTGPILASIESGSTKTFKGTILFVSDTSFEGGIQPAKTVKIKTANAEETILLGPAWYITNQRLDWKTGDTISVEACRTSINGKPHWLARSADVKGTKLELISSGNAPAWDKR